MPERVKLTEPGSVLVMRVRSVKPETVERNEYYLFANGTKEMLVPQSAVKAQLERMEVDSVDSLIGKDVKFSRSTKMSRAQKPYWNVDLASPEEIRAAMDGASAAGPPAASNGAVAAGATSASGSHKSFQDIYASATKFVIEQIVPKYTTAKFEVTAGDVRGMVADLFTAKLKES
jgi:hypothetical protein